MVMVCDQTARKSFEDVKRHWLPEVKNNADADVEKVLLLNKMDLTGKDLDVNEVQSFAEKEQMMVYETSAKTGKNVNGVFVELCRKLIGKNNDIQRRRNRNVNTEKSLFKSSAYDNREVQLRQDNTRANEEEEKKQCCLSN